MSTATSETPARSSATPTCPAWCQTHHVAPEAEDHIRLLDAVHRKPRLESVAIELEQAAENPDPLIVISLFTQTKRAKAMSAGLTIDQARHAHAALGEALRLAGESCQPRPHGSQR